MVEIYEAIYLLCGNSLSALLDQSSDFGTPIRCDKQPESFPCVAVLDNIKDEIVGFVPVNERR